MTNAKELQKAREAVEQAAERVVAHQGVMLPGAQSGALIEDLGIALANLRKLEWKDD